MAYENTYKMPIVVTHTMNVFGERQNPEKFIPGVVSAVRDGKQVPQSDHYLPEEFLSRLPYTQMPAEPYPAPGTISM